MNVMLVKKGAKFNHWKSCFLYIGLSRFKIISDGISSDKKGGNGLVVLYVFLVVSIFVAAVVFSYNMYLRAIHVRRSANVRYTAFDDEEMADNDVTTDSFDTQIRRLGYKCLYSGISLKRTDGLIACVAKKYFSLKMLSIKQKSQWNGQFFCTQKNLREIALYFKNSSRSHKWKKTRYEDKGTLNMIPSTMVARNGRSDCFKVWFPLANV